jgi:hypothetical protein
MRTKPAILRLLQHPEREFRLGFLFPTGIAGLGNLVAAGFAWVCLTADILNSATGDREGKVLAAAIIMAIPLGLIWGWILAAIPYYLAKWKPGAHSLKKMPLARWVKTVGTAFGPIWLVNIACCLDLILLDGKPWVEGSDNGRVYILLWTIKVVAMVGAFLLYYRLLRTRPGWNAILAAGTVFGSVLLAFAISFLIFVVVLGIPLQ